MKLTITPTLFFALTISLAVIAVAHEGHDHSKPDDKDKLTSGSNREIRGEIVDLMCYIDHNAMGEKHAQCAATCVKDGGPVGIVSQGKAYLVVGEHKPMNDQLVEHCGKTITLRGKLAERGGMAMLENAEIVKK
ncbi:MAG TPA: hypothetical protein VJ719_14615 [Chthoniobacterales bacterium]|nr:hypothetical protein [Chthoniobacterales bacterium]